MVRKQQLPCCALCQLYDLDNATTEHEINRVVTKLKEEAKEVWNPNDRRSGERACFTITTPNEAVLAETLEKCGFKPIVNFNRRNGYPQNGLLTMWFLNW